MKILNLILALGVTCFLYGAKRKIAKTKRTNFT